MACLLLSIAPLSTLAQSRVGFAYDAAGNRVKKELNVNPPQKTAKKSRASCLWDNIGQSSVEVMTDKSTGNIKIAFKGGKPEDNRNISVYTSAGAKIYECAAETGECIISLADHPAGIYVLTITINDTPSTWKITKR